MAHTAGGERACVLEPRPGRSRAPPVLHDELLAALRLQLAPALQRALGEPDVVRVGVGEPEDPGGAVARAAVVAEAELLDQDDAAPRLRERAGSRDAGDPRADYDDVGVAAHRLDPTEAACEASAGDRQPSSARAAFVAARASAL